MESFIFAVFRGGLCCYYPTGWIFNNLMSLLIVGSTSRITQNIILHLARQNAYKSITISDLLPLYGYHHRYYRLRKALAEQQTQTTVSLTKLARTDELYAQVQQHQDVLFVTHDYFQSVTSKTKLMELTAEFSKNKSNVVFATPLQYDHFGFANPLQNYLNSQEKVKAINKKASFVRSDIQDGAETLAYLHQPKSFIEETFFSVPESFAPRVVSSSQYAEAVANALLTKESGKLTTLTGENAVNYREAGYNKDIISSETCHFRENISNLLKKYSGLPKLASANA